MSRPDLPQAIAALFCGQVAINPASQNVSLIEVMPQIAARAFPAELPPLQFITILVGGQPGKVYSTKLRFLDPSGSTLFERAGSDVPFTTQIKRVNYSEVLQGFSNSKDAIKQAGRYRCELLIDNECVAGADLDIVKAPQQLQPQAAG